MSFWVYVHRREDEPPEVPVPTRQDDEAGWAAWDAYAAELGRITLYEAPLGGDSFIGIYWSHIASQLGLPMLAALYDQGLQVQDPLKLTRLERELDKLEGFWNAHNLREPDRASGLHGRLREDLEERLGYFREAIKVAREHRAVLTVM